MTRGRKRKFDPSIPKHIDQKKIPKGAYWRSRDRYWFTFLPGIGGKPTRRRIAGEDALLSDLHREMELAGGVDRDTLDYLLEAFSKSLHYKEIGQATRDDYGYSRLALQRHQTKLGIPFASLKRSRITMPLIQRLVEEIGAVYPAKANHIKRYLSVAFSWGMRNGLCKTNPAEGVKQAKERGEVTIPDAVTMRAAIALLKRRGSLTARRKGALAPYVWAVAEIAFRCRMRGVEVRRLTDVHATPEGILAQRVKGSRDNITEWCQELHDAWDWLVERRAVVWAQKHCAVPMRPEKRPLIVVEHGGAITKSALKSAWTRAMAALTEAKLLAEDERFGLHAMKHRGITDTKGTRAEKQHASGHKNEHMMDRYDHEIPIVKPAGYG